MAACIMNVSAEPALRDTRFRLLANAGFSVVSVHTVVAAQGLLEAGRSFDAIVVCDSIPAKERQHLLIRAKRRGIPVVLVGSVVPEPSERSTVEATVGRLEDPTVFLSSVIDAVRKKEEAASG